MARRISPTPPACLHLLDHLAPVVRFRVVGVRYNGRLSAVDGAIGTPDTASWLVADAMLSYPFSPHLDLQFNLYNLFDNEYVAAINKSGYRYTPGQPRSALFQRTLPLLTGE